MVCVVCAAVPQMIGWSEGYGLCGLCGSTSDGRMVGRIWFVWFI
jgi:hypothetical protein